MRMKTDIKKASLTRRNALDYIKYVYNVTIALFSKALRR